MKSIRGKIMILFGMVGTICLLISLGISSVISYQLLERSQKEKYQYEAMKFGGADQWLVFQESADRRYNQNDNRKYGFE
ncbi:MAG: hypothetical protein PHY47_16305 [Lachnospiraceae bacterium]|nr:hypothetical protein [Lachnospiraceae bacterium]